MRRTYCVWAVLVTAFLCWTAYARPALAEQGTITVSVTDREGNMLVGAAVNASAIGSGVGVYFWTNSQGKVSFVLPTGSYNVRADADGYHGMSMVKEIDGRRDITFRLRKVVLPVPQHVFAPGMVKSISANPIDPHRIALGGENGAVYMMSNGTIRQIGSHGAAGAVIITAYSPDGGNLATVCDKEGLIQFWPQRDGHHDNPLKVGDVTAILWLDNSSLLVGNAQGGISLCDVHTGAMSPAIHAHSEEVYCIVGSSDGALIATSGGDGMLKVWDRGMFQLVWKGKTNSTVSNLGFMPGTHRLVGNDGSTLIRIWDLDLQRVSSVMTTADVYSLTMLPGSRFASSCSDGSTTVWTADRGTALPAGITAQHIVASVDGRWLFGAGDGQEICVWQL